MTSTRQQRATATRQRIVAAAHDLFVAQGYRATSLRDIAAAASVSHPGLLGHYSSKDELLAEVVARLEADNEDLISAASASGEPGLLLMSEIAAHNAETEGYLALFAALTGEASAPTHPSHQRMRERYARLRTLSADTMEFAMHHGVVAEDREAAGEVIRQMAVWDGLQLMAQYLPDRVDVVDLLEEYEGMLALPIGWTESAAPDGAEPAGPLPTMKNVGEAEDVSGYAAGRRRRARIVSDAMRLFACTGYGDTSLREIAEAVGASKSTLLHHYPTKEALLGAVLGERDTAIRTFIETLDAHSAADLLRALPDGAVRNAEEEPGLIEVYAVLSCEAVPAAHPAHDYFVQRFTHSIEYFGELFRLAGADGALSPHRDPEHEAIRLIALWDGLQYQWLYDRDAVDVAAQLRLHLADALPAR